MTLNFEDEMISGYFLNRNSEMQEMEEMDPYLNRYLNWVNSVVEQHRGPTIKRIRVYFDPSYTSSINKWIQFAVEKRVQMLVVIFLQDRMHRGVINLSCTYPKNPHQLLGIKEEPALERLCSLLNISDIPSLRPYAYIGFKSLKFIKFLSLEVTGEVLECFLSAYPFLEHLSVHSCENLGNLRVFGPSIALKYLEINLCAIKSIEICDASLVSFIYIGGKINLILRHVPRLVEVSIQYFTKDLMMLAFTQLSCCLSQLEVLKLNSSMHYKKDRVFLILNNLKHLELTFEEDDGCCLLQLASFIKASPCLHRIVLL